MVRISWLKFLGDLIKIHWKIKWVTHPQNQIIKILKKLAIVIVFIMTHNMRLMVEMYVRSIESTKFI